MVRSREIKKTAWTVISIRKVKSLYVAQKPKREDRERIGSKTEIVTNAVAEECV